MIYRDVAENVDIKEFIQDWVDGVYPNHGVVWMEPGEMVSQQKTKFYSSDAPSPNKPELIINYSYYCGTRPYESCTSTEVNCAGYALGCDDFIEPYELGINEDYMYDDELNEDSVNTINQVEDYIRTQLELNLDNFVGTGNWSFIYAYDERIYDGFYRVYFQIGFDNSTDHDDILDEGEGLLYHWRYETSAGYWAEKAGEAPSHIYNPTPADFLPTGGDDSITSVIILLQVRHIYV